MHTVGNITWIKVSPCVPVLIMVEWMFLFVRYDSNSGGEREIQRTMLELLNQLDGFDSRGDVKVCYYWMNTGDWTEIFHILHNMNELIFKAYFRNSLSALYLTS